MPSKMNLIASSAAVVLALAPAAFAAPIAASQCMPQCKSLGKGVLALPTADIYVGDPQPQMDRLAVSYGNELETYMPGNGPAQEFEFIQCAEKKDPINGPRAVDTFQGHIKDKDGKCVTVHINKLTSKPIGVKMEDCQYREDAGHGGVVDNQHFQFTKDAWQNFYLVEFLGRIEGGNPSYNLWSTFNDVEVGFEIKRDYQCNGEGCSFLIAQI